MNIEAYFHVKFYLAVLLSAPQFHDQTAFDYSEPARMLLGQAAANETIKSKEITRCEIFMS